MSAFAVLCPSEQVTAVNRLGGIEETKTEDGVDSTINPNSGAVPPLAWAPKETARRLEVRAAQEGEAAAAA